MKKNRESNLFLKCRLCGILGQHHREILHENHPIACSHNAHALNETIVRCVGVWVEPDDDSTKICEKCFTTSSGLSKAKSLHNGVDRTISDVVVQSNETQDLENVGYLFIATDARNCCESIDSPVTCMFISLIGDETDSEKDKTKFDTQTRVRRESSACGDRECSAMHLFQTIYGEIDHPVIIGVSENDNVSAKYGDGSFGWVLGSAQNHLEDGIAVECESNDCDRIAFISSLGEAKTDSKVVDAITNGQAIDIRSKNTSVKTKRIVRRDVNKGGERSFVKCTAFGRCSELFESDDAMKRHLSTYHARGAKRTFCCYLCKRTLARKSNLKYHIMTIHTGSKEFKCSFAMCSQEFSCQRNLKEHMNIIHVQNVVFNCTKCPMMFYRKWHLKLHLGSEHGEGAIYCCSLCKKTFLHNSSLQKHKKVKHDGSFRFQCSVEMCSKSFTNKQGLNEHTNAVHTKDRVFTCTECPSKFYHRASLTKHKANVHFRLNWNYVLRQAPQA